MKKKVFFLLFVWVLGCATMSAQGTVELKGIVVEKSTGEAVASATIQLLAKADSAFVSGVTTGATGEFVFKGVKTGEYTLKVSFIGYVTKCVETDLTAHKKTTVDIGYVTLETDDILLAEAEVTAHASKVAVAGDSLVFNANAYRVPQGSTLEALVRQLPGAKVDKEGNITINGKSVSKILVDGKEFFLNDKEVATKNIPTEMIDKIKTYSRKSDLSRVSGIDDGEEETVLDLEVKEGMKEGWFGNVNVGAGTKHRYAERFNVNRFKDDAQVTILGGANNVADMGFGGGGGMWGSWGQTGLRCSKEVGANFATDKPRLETGGSVRYRYNGSDTENTSSTEYFNATSAKYNESRSKSLTSNQRVSSNFRLEWKPDTMTNLIFRPNFSYARSRGLEASTAGSFADKLMDVVINTNANHTMTYSTSTTFGGELQLNRKFNDKGRNLTLRATGNYTDGSSRQLSAADITYNTLGTSLQNNRYYDTPSRNHGVQGQVIYSEPIGHKTYLQLGYTYDYSYSKNDRRAFVYASDAYQTLLQKMQHSRYDINAVLRFMADVDYVLDGTDSVASRLSQFSEYRNFNQAINLSFRKVRDHCNFSAGIDLLPQRSTLNYKYMGHEYPEISRSVFNIAPRVNLRWNPDKQTNLHIRYNGRTRQPGMTDLLDIKDDSNPLVITKGNPGLKPSFSHNLDAEFDTYQADKQRGLFSWLWLNATRNSIDKKTTYDNQTGVRTTMPININGNWTGGGGIGFSTGIGQEKAFNLDVDLGGDYAHNVGFYNNAANGDEATDMKSVTRNISLDGGLELSYRTEQFSVMLSGRLAHAHSKNNLDEMGNQDTYDFIYGTQLEWTAPWGTSLTTDIGMNSRRGYAGRGMNTDELLWNVQLSQSFLKGRALTVMLEVNDILGQQTNIRRNITALMRSDTRYNAIYQYGMLRVIYRFSFFGGKNVMGTKSERSSASEGEYGGFGGWMGGWQ